MHMTDVDEGTVYLFECGVQGIQQLELTVSEIRAFVQKEQNAAQRTAAHAVERVPGINANPPNLTNCYNDYWSNIYNQPDASLPQAFAKAIKDATDLRVLLSDSPIHKRLFGSNAPSASLARYVFSSGTFGRYGDTGFRDQIEALNTLFSVFPGTSGYNDLQRISAAAERVARAETQAEKAREESVRFQLEGEARLLRIQEIFTAEASTQQPSRYWNKVKEDTAFAARLWLAAFAAAIAVPLVFLVISWDHITAILATLSSGTQGLGLASAIVVAAPFIAYGWFLKHLSRGYIQNYQISADAGYRSVLSTTFVGLAKEVNLNIGDAERAILLNALSRPVPPHQGDDGPPAGILEFLKK